MRFFSMRFTRRCGELLFLISFIAVTAFAQDSPLVAAARGGMRGIGAMRPALPPVHIVKWFNSDKHSLRDFRGHVVLLDFWTTWCPSCVAAHPHIEKMVSDLGPRGFAAVLIHDRKTHTSRANEVPSESVLPQYIAEHHITVPVAIADAGEFQELGIHGIPHYVLVDRRGFIRYSSAGNLPDERDIRALLAE